MHCGEFSQVDAFSISDPQTFMEIKNELNTRLHHLEEPG